MSGLEGLFRRCYGQGNRSSDALELLGGEIIFRPEVLDLPGYLAGERRGIKERNGIYTADPRTSSLPKGLHSDAIGAYDSDAAHYDSTARNLSVVHLDTGIRT